MTRDEWVQAAVDAAVEQGFGAAIEDPDVIAFIADLFGEAEPSLLQSRLARLGGSSLIDARRQVKKS